MEKKYIFAIDSNYGNGPLKCVRVEVTSETDKQIKLKERVEAFGYCAIIKKGKYTTINRTPVEAAVRFAADIAERIEDLKQELSQKKRLLEASEILEISLKNAARPVGAAEGGDG